MTFKSLIVCNVHVTRQILLQTLTYKPIQCSKNKPIVKESSLAVKFSTQNVRNISAL